MAHSLDTYVGSNAEVIVQGTCVATPPAIRQRPVQCEHGLAGDDWPWRVGTDTSRKQSLFFPLIALYSIFGLEQGWDISDGPRGGAGTRETFSIMSLTLAKDVAC